MKKCICILLYFLITFSSCNIDEGLINPDKNHDLAELTLKNGQNPKKVLISETSSRLWILDLQTLNLTEFQSFEEWGNFDIQYLNPSEIVIATYLNQRIDQFNLQTKELQTLLAGSPLSHPIGLAVSPEGNIYIADQGNGKIFSFNSRTKVLDLLADKDPDGEPLNSPDGIVVAPGGKNIYFSDQTGSIYRITLKEKKIDRIATTIGSLNGMAFLSPDCLAVVSIDSPPALFKVNISTGEVTTLYTGSPLRNPEDVAIDPQSKNIFIVDSDIMRKYEGFRPAIYLYNINSGSLMELYAGEPLGDIVDILLEPFTGFN